MSSQRICRVINYVWSTTALVGGLVVVGFGISKEAYILPVPISLAYVIFLVVLVLIFYLEGLMIAVTATKDMLTTDIDPDRYPRARMIHALINASPKNMKRFIVGRQFCTVLTTFIIAQLTTFPEWKSSVAPGLFWILFNSGASGVFVSIHKYS